MSDNQLTIVAKSYSLEAAVAKPLIDAFMPHYEQALALVEKSAGVKVTDATQLTEMKQAAELRKALKATRCAADVVRKKEKDVYLRMGNCIQGIYNRIAEITEPAEERLREAEEFAARAEAARFEALYRERARLIEQASGVPDDYVLGRMDEATFQATLAGLKDAVARRRAREAEEKAAAAKAEAARIAEQRRISMENARLRRERDEADAAAKNEMEARKAIEREAAAKLAKERADAAAVAQQEREAREAAEFQLSEVTRKQQEQERAAAEAARKAAAAPDAEKIAAYAEALAKLPEPVCASNDGKLAADNIRANVREMIAWIHSEAKRL